MALAGQVENTCNFNLSMKNLIHGFPSQKSSSEGSFTFSYMFMFAHGKCNSRNISSLPASQLKKIKLYTVFITC